MSKVARRVNQSKNQSENFEDSCPWPRPHGLSTASNQSLGCRPQQRPAKSEDWAMSPMGPHHRPSLSLALDGQLRLASGFQAGLANRYMYGLCPTLFHHILSQIYWLNFCKLVSGVRLLQRYSIICNKLIKGHSRLMEFVQEYETLYYQRMEARIHFVRQSVHLLTHIGPETLCAGPLSCYAQWTLETTIGYLGREIRQDHDQFANLTQRAILRAQVNSVQAHYPNVRIDVRSSSDDSLPANYLAFGENPGYMFLPRHKEHPSALNNDEAEALRSYWHEKGWPGLDNWNDSVCCWAKLQLPNGQKAQSVWFEEGSVASLCHTSCVEVICTVFII
jgi:hypothetical protein